MKGKRALVSGANGFVGSSLVRRLLREGFLVHAILRPGSSRSRLEPLLRELEVLEVDLRDEHKVSSLVDTFRPDIVFHLATHGAYPFQTDADGIIQTNILGTWNLLRAIARVGCEVFVNAGSSSEYGFKQFAMRETDLLEPNSYYAVAKSAQTLLCQHFAVAERLPITTLRLFSVYGPYEEESRFVPTIISKSLLGQELSLVPADTARDFVYVDDVVDAFLSLEPLSKLYGEIINVGTGIQSTVRDVVDIVLEHTKSGVTARYGTMEARAWDSPIWVGDTTKSRRLLGWYPTTPLFEGLRQTVDWFRERYAGNRR